MVSRDFLISVRDVCFVHNEKMILNHITFDVQRGEFVTIIGSNGSGKSLLLKCILGLVKPSSGQIITSSPLRIGYVPQFFSCMPTFPITVSEFLKLQISFEQSFFEQIIEETGVHVFQNQHMHHLSGGQRQRVLLVRALLHRPHLLILDEPVQNIDVLGQSDFYAILDKLYKRECFTVMMVSHDLHIVARSTCTVLCLHHKICCSGTPVDVFENREVMEALYGSSLSKDFSFYRHSHEASKE